MTIAKKAKPLLEVHVSSERTKSDVFSYGYSFINISLKLAGMQCTLNISVRPATISSPILSMHNLMDWACGILSSL
jgi:hypothetical protein